LDNDGTSQQNSQQNAYYNSCNEGTNLLANPNVTSSTAPNYQTYRITDGGTVIANGVDLYECSTGLVAPWQLTYNIPVVQKTVFGSIEYHK